jgi:adenylosuccinate synthase
MGRVICIVGGLWGDEAKGRLTDVHVNDPLDRIDMVLRYAGGSNAGHTVINQHGTFKLHQVPSGIFNPDVDNLLGSGMAIDPLKLVQEITDLRSRNVSPRLIIDCGAAITLPHHRQLDELTNKIGTTGSGIGPTYADRAKRIGLRMGDMLRPDFEIKVRVAMEAGHDYIGCLGGEPALPGTISQATNQYRQAAEVLGPLIADTVPLIHEVVRDPQRGLLCEGAQGTLLDLQLGTYPWVTSSNPTVGGAVLCGVPARSITAVVLVSKCYTSRVGQGPFPTEWAEDERTARIRQRGNERGTTTGRDRRLGDLDLVALRYSCRVNGATHLAVGHLDVLAGETIKVCTGYRINGGPVTTDFPRCIEMADVIEPVLEDVESWNGDLSGARSVLDLPKECISFFKQIEDYTGVPVRWSSVGPKAEQTILFS